MSVHLKIDPGGWNSAARTKSGAESTSGLFQRHLNQMRMPEPEKLSPESIRYLATTLMTALDRASMGLMFSEHDSSRIAAPELLSTDMFLAMRGLPMSGQGTMKGADETSGSGVANAAATAVSIAAAEANSDPDSSVSDIIESTAASLGLDPKLIEAVVKTESNFDPDAVSPVGAQGLMQLMPATADELGVTDPFDPEQNIRGGSRYLKQLLDRYDGELNLALAAYNWGMGNLERHPEKMPAETVSYIAKVTALLEGRA